MQIKLAKFYVSNSPLVKISDRSQLTSLTNCYVDFYRESYFLDI